MTSRIATKESPFHAGEREVQARLGVSDIEDWARKVVRPYLPPEHRAFHTALPFLVVAARDAMDRPWATLLTGPDGFVTSPDARALVIDAKPGAGDALNGRFEAGADVGILGIELATRRRNRVNGRIRDDGARALVFAVDQAFGNCPQYIREREWRRIDASVPGQPKTGQKLSLAQRQWIENADTFFIASGHRGNGEKASFGMDASHRGGEPGFVSVENNTRLIFPDFAGNNHFNTMGNLVLDPRVGLLFVDFETGSLLQLTGRASIDWESDTVAKSPGAHRLVTIDIDEIVELPTAIPLRWDAEADSVRSLRLVEKKPESADVTSFIFEARDGGTLAPFEAGQHLPIDLELPGNPQKFQRTYTLSGAPGSDRYRISVKREPGGLVSNLLHDYLEPGAILDARKPAGDFTLPDDDRPIVLVSAGVGVTPMVSMLHALVEKGADRPVWFVHGARDGAHHPLATEILDLIARHPNATHHTVFSRPSAKEMPGVDFHREGRIDGALLADLVKNGDAHFLLCGPTSFMAAIQSDLEANGVPASRILMEKFN